MEAGLLACPYFPTHRTGVETADVEGVLEGNISEFIQAEIEGKKAEKTDDTVNPHT